MTFPSTWIIGSLTLATDAGITVGGVPVVIPAGEYYLDDPTGSLSLIEAVLAAVTPQMTLPGIYIARDRKIRITDSAPFTWTAVDARLQVALGIASTIGPTSSAAATDISVLLWSPAYCATTTGHPGGTTGAEHPTRQHLSSQSGLTQSTTVQGTSQVRAKLSWAQVLRARAWTEGFDGGAPGDYRRFWVDVLKPGSRWKWYASVAESATADATAAVLVSPFGPYKTPTLVTDWWERSVSNSDVMSDVSLAGTLTAEIG